jgi:uncharacterized protein
VKGLNRHTGRAIYDLDHLRQSIVDILGTPKGTRVMRRDYGSDLPDLIDAPLTDVVRLRTFAAAVGSLASQEPRLRVDICTLVPSATDPGRAVLAIEGRVATGERLTAEAPL